MVAAGGCLLCHADEVGVIGAFIPASGGAPIMYVICPACWASYPPSLLSDLAEQLLTGAA